MTMLLLLLALIAIVAVWLSGRYMVRHYLVLMTRLRNLSAELEWHKRRDAERLEYCTRLGHDLDEQCRCRRCLSSQHDWKVKGMVECWVEDDPGALYLDSNFQPEGHTELREQRKCARCGSLD